MGFVYIIVSKEHPYLKIGITQNPEMRLTEIEAPSPFKYEFLHVVRTKNARSIEKRIHLRLKRFNKKGEWFKCKQETAISALLKETRKLDKEASHHQSLLEDINAWKDASIKMLSSSNAPRVITLYELSGVLKSNEFYVPNSALREFIKDLESSKMFLKIRRGIWLNLLASPTPSAWEAVPKMRAEAVISLESVLFEDGVVHNKPDIIQSVVPSRPRGGACGTNATGFRFIGIEENLLNAGPSDDRLMPSSDYMRATPEAALVHLLYLSLRYPEKFPMPHVDSMTLSKIDDGRLRRLSELYGIGRHMNGWLLGEDQISTVIDPILSDPCGIETSDVLRKRVIRLDRFGKWLETHKNFSKHTVANTKSRINRARRLLNGRVFSNLALELATLEEVEEFSLLPTGTRSDLRTSLRYYREWQSRSRRRS